MKDEEKSGEKKIRTAKKMFSKDKLECDKCGSRKHSTKEHKAGGRQEFKPQDDFSEKDEKKEKSDLRKKDSNLNKGGDWNT
jgi:hypothetical protein